MGTRKNKPYRADKAVQGAMRRAHFENGLPLSLWRGQSKVIPDKKKQHNKERCKNTED